MTIPRDLMLAILSMDSYNRGYGVGLYFARPSLRLGNATILNIDLPQGSEPAGFYAIAYDMTGEADGGEFADGERVISYRGSDAVGGLPWKAGFWTGDLLNGYGLALGSYLHPQAILARQFYQTVVGTANGADPFVANVTTTGHSLGGGLAGFVARLYGNSGVIFDNMTFELAASNAYDDALENPMLYADLYGTVQAQAPSNAKLSAFASFGEFLTANRALGGQSLASVDLLANGSGQGPLELHSMALQVALQYARSPDVNPNWFYASTALWDAYFDETLAEHLPGVTPFKGTDSLSGTVRTAIAYSALDSGERPFGDVAIRAMFDDAADFGSVLQAGLLPNWVGSQANAAIGRVIVEFAGLMALRDVEGLDADASAANKHALDGVISLTGDAASPTSMRLRFDAALWGLGTGGVHQSHERTGLIYSAANDNTRIVQEQAA